MLGVKGLKLSSNFTNFTTYMKILVRNPLMWSNVNMDLLRMIMVQAMQMQQVFVDDLRIVKFKKEMCFWLNLFCF